MAPRIDVRLFPESITVGDRVEAELLLVGAERVVAAPRFPSWRQGWGEAEVLEVREPERVAGAGGASWRQRLVLTGFAPGKLALPPVEVAVPLTGRTMAARTPAGLVIDVRSVLPPGEETPEAKPPEPARPLPVGERFWWTAAIGALLLAAAIALYARRSRVEGAEDVPRMEPLPELLAELDRLTERPAVEAHTRLSQALRRYLGRALGFAALERTTTEIHRQLAGAARYAGARSAAAAPPDTLPGALVAHPLPGTLIRRMVELLRACDLVKFARLEVGRERTLERLAQTRELAGEVERELRSAAEEAAASREAA